MAMDVTIQYGPSEIPVSSVWFNKKHFNPIGGHFLRMFSILSSGRKWPPIGFKRFLLNNAEYTGTFEEPYMIVTSVAME